MFPTYSEVKTRLGITDTSKDDLIKLLLPSIMEEVFNATGDYSDSIYVSSDDISFKDDDISSTDTNFIEAGFIKGMWVLVEGSDINKLRIAKLSEVAQHALSIDTTNYGEGNFEEEAAGQLVRITQIAMPKAMKGVILDIMAFKLDKGSKGVKSESIGDYSASFTETYPKSITDTLNRYRKLR